MAIAMNIFCLFLSADDAGCVELPFFSYFSLLAMLWVYILLNNSFRISSSSFIWESIHCLSYSYFLKNSTSRIDSIFEWARAASNTYLLTLSCIYNCLRNRMKGFSSDNGSLFLFGRFLRARYFCMNDAIIQNTQFQY